MKCDDLRGVQMQQHLHPDRLGGVEQHALAIDAAAFGQVQMHDRQPAARGAPEDPQRRPGEIQWRGQQRPAAARFQPLQREPAGRIGTQIGKVLHDAAHAAADLAIRAGQEDGAGRPVARLYVPSPRMPGSRMPGSRMPRPRMPHLPVVFRWAGPHAFRSAGRVASQWTEAVSARSSGVCGRSSLELAWETSSWMSWRHSLRGGRDRLWHQGARAAGWHVPPVRRSQGRGDHTRFERQPAGWRRGNWPAPSARPNRRKNSFHVVGRAGYIDMPRRCPAALVPS